MKISLLHPNSGPKLPISVEPQQVIQGQPELDTAQPQLVFKILFDLAKARL